MADGDLASLEVDRRPIQLGEFAGADTTEHAQGNVRQQIEVGPQQGSKEHSSHLRDAQDGRSQILNPRIGNVMNRAFRQEFVPQGVIEETAEHGAEIPPGLVGLGLVLEKPG